MVSWKTVVDLNLLQEGTAESSKGGNWGARSGPEDDKELLFDIITEELEKTGNHVDCLLSK